MSGLKVRFLAKTTFRCPADLVQKGGGLLGSHSANAQAWALRSQALCVLRPRPTARSLVGGAFRVAKAAARWAGGQPPYGRRESTTLRSQAVCKNQPCSRDLSQPGFPKAIPTPRQEGEDARRSEQLAHCRWLEMESASLRDTLAATADAMRRREVHRECLCMCCAETVWVSV